MNPPDFFMCINCGNVLQELQKKFSNSMKLQQCHKCHKVADKYIEFAPVIVLMDAMLLSDKAFRHILYNQNFKFHRKLSLVLLLLDSFAMWRRKSADISEKANHNEIHEKGFYICCFQNIIDHLLITTFLLLVSFFLLPLMEQAKRNLMLHNLKKHSESLLKATTVAYFSKFFLLPTMVWRQNTTHFGAGLHHFLVNAHHICALILTFAVVAGGSFGIRKFQATVVVLPLYLLKEYLMLNIRPALETIF